ncbi:MAG: M20/M25/M40 family metallo-hydrolase [Thermoanaerobaculia bacterium]
MSPDLQHCVDLLQQMIRTLSLPGHEGELASLVANEMHDLGYDEIRIDEVGNVLGRIEGRGQAPALMFNTHLDHVDVGDPAGWPHPPFGGEIHDDRVWGRGAVDIKGPMAAQVVGVARLLAGERPPGDVWVTAVVQEEIGGVGARHLAETLPPIPIVVVGEPSHNTLRRGHRGRTELVAHISGRSVHASVPERGVNPLFALGLFLSGLETLKMPTDTDLGPSTVAPTLLRTDQTSANVVPGEVWQTCDWRNIPGQSGEDARAMLQAVAARVLAENPAHAESEIDVVIPVIERRTYTGLERPIPGANPAYILPADHPAVVAAEDICREVLKEDRPTGVWQFATDGGHFAEAGMAPVGFGPGDEFLAHTVNEHIEISALEEAMAVNEALARNLAAEAS